MSDIMSKDLLSEIVGYSASAAVPLNDNVLRQLAAAAGVDAHEVVVEHNARYESLRTGIMGLGIRNEPWTPSWTATGNRSWPK